jgi:hypothetical protein
MKLLRLALVAALGCSSTACFQFNTLVHLNADGSGTVDQRVLFTTAALEQMKQLAGVAGGSADAAGFNPLSEETAREMAAELGPGVRYVSSTTVQTADGEGRDIVYAFDDIRTLQMSQQPPGGTPLPGVDSALSFTLTNAPGGTATLRIGMPAVAGFGGGGAQPGNGAAGIPELPPAAQLAMLRPLLAGARIAIAIEPNGRLVRTSSPYVDGNRVTLLEVNLDQLLADETLFTRLQAAPDRAAAEALLKDVPGVKVVAQPEIAIEFAP